MAREIKNRMGATSNSQKSDEKKVNIGKAKPIEKKEGGCC